MKYRQTVASITCARWLGQLLGCVKVRFKLEGIVENHLGYYIWKLLNNVVGLFAAQQVWIQTFPLVLLVNQKRTKEDSRNYITLELVSSDDLISYQIWSRLAVLLVIVCLLKLTVPRIIPDFKNLILDPNVFTRTNQRTTEGSHLCRLPSSYFCSASLVENLWRRILLSLASEFPSSEKKKSTALQFRSRCFFTSIQSFIDHSPYDSLAPILWTLQQTQLREESPGSCPNGEIQTVIFWCASFIHIHPFREMTQLNNDTQSYKHPLATAPPMLRLNLHDCDETRNCFFRYQMETHIRKLLMKFRISRSKKEDDSLTQAPTGIDFHCMARMSTIPECIAPWVLKLQPDHRVRLVSEIYFIVSNILPEAQHSRRGGSARDSKCLLYEWSGARATGQEVTKCS
jgi:hypothetical protein